MLCRAVPLSGRGYITAVRSGQRAGFGSGSRREVARSRAASPLLRRAARAAADADSRPPPRRSTKTRRGTASGMYGNAVCWRIDTGERHTSALQPHNLTASTRHTARRGLATGERRERAIDHTARARERDERILRMQPLALFTTIYKLQLIALIPPPPGAARHENNVVANTTVTRTSIIDR